MIVEEVASPTTQRVDDLMRDLYSRSRGTLHQTLIADHAVADAYRNVLDPGYPVSRRAVVRAAQITWQVLRRLLGRRYGAWAGGLLWTIIGAPDLLRRSLKMHSDAYIRQGDSTASLVLLRTGVANEPLIARWIEAREKEAVVMLQYNGNAENRLRSLHKLPRLARVHACMCLSIIGEISRFAGEVKLSPPALDALLPTWFVLLARQAISISWNYVWAEGNLGSPSPKFLYFTMNYGNENAFRLALPDVAAAYVEHGFPRRDIPPLPCRQYVYSEGYADYLRSFDDRLHVDVIGLDYFSAGSIQPTKTIVVASLQDWPQYKIERVSALFNDALAEARRAGWKLVFRSRQFDSESFANALRGSWNDVSRADEETFLECLKRSRPAMVWTTWSTAVLDAAAQNVMPVAFITPDLHDYFVADLGSFAFVVNGEESLQRLVDSLRQADEVEAKRKLEPRGRAGRRLVQ